MWQNLLCHNIYIDGLVQERRNSIANALELHLSFTNPSTWCHLRVMASQITSSSNICSTVQLNNEENIRALYYWLLCEGNSPVTWGFPSQRASNMESVSISWHHHDIAWKMNSVTLCTLWIIPKYSLLITSLFCSKMAINYVLLWLTLGGCLSI